MHFAAAGAQDLGRHHPVRRRQRGHGAVAVPAQSREKGALGIDGFLYCAAYGLPMDLQRQSLQRFVDEVVPAFAEPAAARAAE